MTTEPTVLRARLQGVMLADRRTLERRLADAERMPVADKRNNALAALESSIVEAEQLIEHRRAALPNRLTYPQDLPITERRPELLETIRANQVVIVAGETGSGKSTQLPKVCLELDRGVKGWIGHTQPRRIAARSIAERIADETNTALGGLVGYTVRFTDQVGDGTLVKVMTDGILLNEIQRDRRLTRYDTIIIDEAHERSLNIDFLLGYLRRLLPKRPDLKLIVTSATIDTERFASHFGDAPVIEVSGRAYPVEVRYRPLDDGPDGPRDQPTAIADATVELFAKGSGDILVFCSGEREIRDATETINDLGLSHTEVLPLYGRLSAAEQHRVFASHTGRRVVVATNVAETSLTVPGIRYVIDAGTARISRYSRRTKVQRLPIEDISQASADQRAGRCGRLGPGVCIRLYGEDDYAARPEFTEPEIRRTNLASVILQMAALGLGDVESFPFLDPPDTRSIRDGVALLEELGAVGPDEPGTKGWLTDIGRRLARLPLDPRLGRMLIEADRNDSLAECLIIVSALSIQDPRERPADLQSQADQLHARFVVASSDFLGWLALWNHLRTERKARTSNQFRRMCRDEFINHRRVREWQDIASQLREVSKELGMKRNRRPADPETIHRSLLAGLLSHVGRKDPDSYEYLAARSARFSINPGSGLFKANPEWVMAGELVETTRLWARSVAPVNPDWIEELGAHLIKRSYSDPWWEVEQGAALAHETATLYGLVLTTDRQVMYASVDPMGARDLFVHHALVHGEWETHHDFVAHNDVRIEEVRALEARKRASDLLVDSDVIHAFYNARIPSEVTSVRHFDRWWRDARIETPNLLDMTLEDLIEPDAEQVDEEAFPDRWIHGDLAFDVEYEFDPASHADGITVEIPLATLDRVDPGTFEWHVPGHRAELLEALVRSLPKQIRKQFVPIPTTVGEIAPRLDPREGGLLTVLRRALAVRSTLPIGPDDFDLAALPHHLRPAYRIIGEAGTVLAEGPDLASLKADLRIATRATVADSNHELERSGLTEWDFGSLPSVVEVSGAGPPISAFPALIDEGDAVGVRLLPTAVEQADEMWNGTRRMLLLQLPSPRRLLRQMVGNELALSLASGPYADENEWMDDCLDCAVDQILADAGGPAWERAGFEHLVARARDQLADQLDAIGRASAEILVRRHRAISRVATLAAPAFDAAAEDVVGQLAQLTYPGFLSGLGADRLPAVARYLAAIEWRLERLPDHPDRDRRHLETITSLEAEHDRLVELYGWTPELVEAVWMLQELRVSLFAQSIGVQGTVSPKRIRAVLAEIARSA